MAASPEEGRELAAVAPSDFDRAADSVGHIAVTEQTKHYARALDDAGDTAAKGALLSQLGRRRAVPARRAARVVETRLISSGSSGGSTSADLRRERL